MRITLVILKSGPFSGSWETRPWPPDMTTPRVALPGLAIAALVMAPETSPAVSAEPNYSQGRGEIVAFGGPATVAADGGAGESQRGRSHHRVLLCPEGGRRYQLADQHAAEPGR